MLSPIATLADLKIKLDGLGVNAFSPPKPLPAYFEILLSKRYDIGTIFSTKTVRKITKEKDPWNVIIPRLKEWQLFEFLVSAVPEDERLTRNSAPFADLPSPHQQEKNVTLTDTEVQLLADIRGTDITEATESDTIIRVSDDLRSLQFTHLLSETR